MQTKSKEIYVPSSYLSVQLGFPLKRHLNALVKEYIGPPKWVHGKESACQCQEIQETQVDKGPSLGEEDSLEEEMATHSSILAGNFHGQRSLVGCSPWCHKESNTTDQALKQNST